MGQGVLGRGDLLPGDALPDLEIITELMLKVIERYETEDGVVPEPLTKLRWKGWYDANPANLNPLPPVQNAAKTIEYMGGADKVIEQARKDYDNGEYRWVASVLNQGVFAEPSNQAARELGVNALE